ncbi:hypothetical protein V8C40DRAFT_232822 [Trichoderma camerunense]
MSTSLVYPPTDTRIPMRYRHSSSMIHAWIILVLAFLQGRCGSQALTYWQPSRLVAPFYTSRSVPKHGNACMAYLLLRISLVSVLPVPCLALDWQTRFPASFFKLLCRPSPSGMTTRVCSAVHMMPQPTPPDALLSSIMLVFCHGHGRETGK